MRMACAGALVAALWVSAAAAQTRPPGLPAPAEAGAVRLWAAPASRDAEQWEQRAGRPIVRNVTDPTLTPFLPDPAQATGAAVIIAPGGGFKFLQIDAGGYDAARWLADHGVAAFVLKYRLEPTPRDPEAFAEVLRQSIVGLTHDPQPSFPPAAMREADEDARRALQAVRARASEWRVDPHRIGYLGFSAGAVMTLKMALATEPADRPDFVGVMYGPMTAVDVPADAPPMFNAMAADDPVFGRAGYDLITSWRRAGRPVEFHLYERGGHGFGLQPKGSTSDLWLEQFYAWMKARKLLVRSPTP